MSPYSHWDASRSWYKNNSLRKMSGLVSKWIMEDSRLENSRYPSEWVSEWVTGSGLPRVYRDKQRGCAWSSAKRSDFYDSQSNEIFTLRTQIFFLLDRKLLLYSTLLKTISISFLIVFLGGVNGIFLEVSSLTYGDLLQKMTFVSPRYT